MQTKLSVQEFIVVPTQTTKQSVTTALSGKPADAPNGSCIRLSSQQSFLEAGRGRLEK